MLVKGAPAITYKLYENHYSPLYVMKSEPVSYCNQRWLYRDRSRRNYIIYIISLFNITVQTLLLHTVVLCFVLLYLHSTKLVEVYWNHLVRLSVCLSVRPSVCRWHGFRSVTQVFFGISISHFIYMHVVGGHGQKPINFQQYNFQNGRLAAILDFSVSGL